MTAHVHQFLCLKDNYGVLLHDSVTGSTAAIDAPEAQPILDALDQKGWTLTDILVTHHHADHVQGIPGLKARFPEARVVAPAKEASKIGNVALEVAEDEIVSVGKLKAKVLETPGHTAGHVVYWFEDESLLFAGDTLFPLGCGRVLETPLPIMLTSLLKLTRLPIETLVYCGHEYTLSNARFALTVDPENALLQSRFLDVEALRKDDKPTVPTTIALEVATNPFLRAGDPTLQRSIGMAGADPTAVFVELRERKNRA
ncbi:hydroxyacylglutathione hydrolase [Lichenifustis flavocetrariae]|uniref:Hydroxyacylglutathione hydrolase n=1 Tax=Lichenifustis flavocetrariae TaxID=2949735 RepID=A0AA41Z1E5_9HYPH|nr:hydroxyacylglutathione hydrolase [Lichenifustis flavocetrariae]MCW6511068.1 hydroxyacylglutathione hydrolase [Lichenifustis flavocetrariae]